MIWVSISVYFFICRILILDLSVGQWDNWIIANFSVYGKFQSVCIDLLAYITIYHNSIDCIFCS